MRMLSRIIHMISSLSSLPNRMSHMIVEVTFLFDSLGHVLVPRLWYAYNYIANP